MSNILRAIRVGLSKSVGGSIKNKELYFGGENVVTPTGQQYSGDYRELYGLRGGRVKTDAMKVVNALAKGAEDMNSISIATGLDETRIKGALKFLEKQGYKVDYYQEGEEVR